MRRFHAPAFLALAFILALTAARFQQRAPAAADTAAAQAVGLIKVLGAVDVGHLAPQQAARLQTLVPDLPEAGPQERQEQPGVDGAAPGAERTESPEDSQTRAGRRFDVSASRGGLAVQAQTERRVTDSSAPRGIIRHGEHWADLILSQGGSSDPRYFKALRESAESLLSAAKKGRVDRVNEKIDGSPSIFLGFTPEGKPFVTYKGEIGLGKRAQRLVTSPQEAGRLFRGPLSPLYKAAIGLFGPRMEAMPKKSLGQYLFQGDLLFYDDGRPGAGRKTTTAGAVRIAANSIAYEVKKGHPLFERLSNAKIGVVIHTIGLRHMRDGRVTAKGGADKAVIQEFVDGLNSPEVFAVTPWKDGVAVGRRDPIDAAAAGRISSLLSGIEAKLGRLSPEFKREWQVRHEARFRVYFNSFLKPPHQGGIYKAAARQEPFSFESLMGGFGTWLEDRLRPRAKTDRSGRTTVKRLDAPGYALSALELVAKHRDGLKNILEAYYDAIQIQYLLQPHIQEIFRSKLGGGESEGVMLETRDTIVKLVDRLGFTLKNNARWNRSASPASPGPFDVWRPGAAFVVLKGQPVHSGHIEMIKRAVELNGGGEVFVIASEKSPNLDASTWRELKAADTKRDLTARAYKHVFTPELRRAILEAGLQGQARVHVVGVDQFWNYVRRARARKEQGKVRLVVGAKEIEEQRYAAQFREFADQLEPLVVPMQKGGLSATQVRAALRAYVEGSSAEKRAAKKVLDAALASVPKAARAGLLKRLVAQWREVDGAVQKVLALK